MQRSTIMLGVIVLFGGSMAQPAELLAPPPWQGNGVGISDELLPPWTPITVAGDKVGVWGRTYRFGVLPMPASVVAQDAEILAGPITLAGTVDGKPLAWSKGTSRVVEVKPHQVRLATTAESGTLRCDGAVPRRIRRDGPL